MKLERFISAIKESKVVCGDVEHLPEHSWELPNFCIHGSGFSTVENGEIIATYSQDREFIQTVLDVAASPEIEFVAHNAKFDLHCWRSAGFNVPEMQIRCTMIMYNLLDENRNDSELGLKKLVKELYNYQMKEFKEASQGGLDSPEFLHYALDDVKWELQLFLDGRPQLQQLEMWNLYTRILNPALYVFFETEHFGKHCDVNVIGELYRKLRVLRGELEKDIYRAVGKININSGSQLARVFFKERGYSTAGIKYMEKSGRYSVDADALAILAKKYPVCEKIMAYKSCDKMISTYLEPLARKTQESVSGRVHASYWLTSATGRTRCSDPNLQNIPTSLGGNIQLDKELKSRFDTIKLRSSFTAPNGHKLVVADFSQIELRLGAIVSQEKELLDAYKKWNCFSCGAGGSADSLLISCPNCGIHEHEKDWKSGKGFWHGQDLHSAVLLHVPEKIRQRLTRNHGKALNFLVLYGGSHWRLNQEYPDLSQDECEEIIHSIMKNRPNLRKYHSSVENAVKTYQPLFDYYGRRRKLPKKEIQLHPRHAVNQCVNFKVQAFAVELMHLSIIKFRKLCVKEGIWGLVKTVNVVHDELVVESPDHLVEITVKLLHEAMESHKVGIPIRAEVKVVDNWGECK